MLCSWNPVLDSIVVNLSEVDVAPCVEQVVCRGTHHTLSILDLLNLIVIELVPISAILSVSRVVPSLELTIVVRHPKKIVDQWLPFFLLLANNVLAHVKALKREGDSCVLFLLHALEPLKIDD